MTSPLLVCGHANVETVLRLDAPALDPAGSVIPDGLSLNVSGVGVNLLRGLVALGSAARLLTRLGDDVAGRTVRAELRAHDLRVVPARATAQTLAVTRPDGTHVFHRDPKDHADAPAPHDAFRAALPGCRAALMTNIGWTRDLLPAARAAGVTILTDVQELTAPDHAYDQPYLRAADVLLLSAARLPDPAAALRALGARARADVIVAGLGGVGALLWTRDTDEMHHQPTFPVPVRHAGGAGDALSAAFAHFLFTRGLPPQEALRLACAAAALKLRGAGSGEGHATEPEVRALAGGPP
ncbi:carbohydrate kinase family protein [Deinococcus sp. JMULE3]|uniref:carbohydrate kinase family protein n=1 Tax=Deinococcus sp. JMULE3 TaxID=2518341 RepID=UPI0015774360|nr:carbohydrate kinase family protein [Deinococcus sp. JMULE3]NTY02516.1 carbohydrate kinase family protein [Deinococcus sp. JMULE3]